MPQRIHLANQILQINDLFGNLSEQEIACLMQAKDLRITEYRKGAVIYLQNERCDTLDVILQGNVIIQSIDEQGSVLTMSEFGPGDLTGVNLLFSQRNSYPMTITAKINTAILHVGRATITDLCMKNQDFLLGLLQYLSDRSVLLTDKIKLISAKSIRQLITEFLAYEYRQQGSFLIRLNISKKELAERFGIPRTSLSRELQKMRRDGLLEFDRDSILIKDELWEGRNT